MDVRGAVTFVNDFDFKGVDRFYTIRAHRPYEARGWCGHQREEKWFTVVHGAGLVAVVKPDEWTFPASNLPVARFVLTAGKPQVLHVPAGHATGSMALSEDTVLMVFSSGHIADAKDDDYLFPVDTWEVNPE